MVPKRHAGFAWQLLILRIFFLVLSTMMEQRVAQAVRCMGGQLRSLRAGRSSSTDEAGLQAAASTTFTSFWRQLAPQIKVMKPMSDLCWVCQKNSVAIMRAANRPDTAKSDVNYTSHEQVTTGHISIGYPSSRGAPDVGDKREVAVPHAVQGIQGDRQRILSGWGTTTLLSSPTHEPLHHHPPIIRHGTTSILMM